MRAWLPTSRVEDTQVLADAEKRQALIDAPVTVPMWVLDVESQRILDVNDAALLAYRYERDAFLALHSHDVSPDESWRAESAATNPRDAFGIFRHRRGDGSSFHVKARTSIVDLAHPQLRLVRATAIADDESQLQYLATASELLLATAGRAEICRALACLAVPRLGDWTIAYDVDGGKVTQCGLAHSDPALEPPLRVFAEQRDVDTISSGFRTAVAEGRVVECRDLDALGAQSVLYVPVLGRGHTLAVLECARSLHEHTDAEQALAEELAQRAGFALSRAVALDEERSGRVATRHLEQGEEQLRDFIDSATDMIHMIAPDGRVLFANRAWREALGHTEEETRQLSVFDVVATRSLERARSIIARCTRGELLPEEELVVVTKDGRELVVRGRANCRFVDGVPVSTRGIYRDVTAEVRTRELLAQAERAHAATARARTAFLDRMSHEMRTPLASVIGFAGVLEKNRKGDLSSASIEYARRIGAQGRHLLAIVDDVLAFAEVEARRVELEVAPIDLAALVGEVVALYAESAQQHDARIVLDLPPGSTDVQTDHATLRRVLRYCLNDAVKEGVKGVVTVRIERDAELDRPERIVVEVEQPRVESLASPIGLAPSGEASAPLSLGLGIAQSLAQALGFDMYVETPADGVSTRVVDLYPLPGRSRPAEDSAKTLHAVLDASPLPIIAFESDWTVRLWNRAAENLFGWAFSEAIERPLAIIPPGDEDAFRAMLRSAIESLHGVADAPFAHVDRKGSRLDVRVSLAPMRNPDGRLRGFLCIVTDVSARKRMEDELRNARQMEIIGRMAGGIGHDFNNLLSVILAHAYFLSTSTELTAENREDIEGVRSAAEQAAAMTRRLSTFARKQLPDRRLVDVNVTLANAERLLRPILGSHVELAVVPSIEAPIVMADPAQVEQVLVNLMLNARDAMPESGALIVEVTVAMLGVDRVARGAIPEAGTYATISVSDTGIGMDEPTRRRIFEPFFSTKAQDRGTGLGLAAVYAIVSESRGGIEVESVVGAGTTFRVHFPLAATEHASAPASETIRSGAGSETVLVVEDQEAVRAIAARILRSRGYEVLLARHGRDALDLLAATAVTVQLVLSDIVMPEMHGYELARRIRAQRPELPLLFMSGYAEHADAQAPGDADIALLRKPFTADELATSVRNALDDAVQRRRT